MIFDLAKLNAAFDAFDCAAVLSELGYMAQEFGVDQLACDTGLSREGLYQALSAKGNPEFSTVMKVIKALGLKLHVEAAHA